MVEASEQSFRIGAIGDVMIARDVGDHFQKTPKDFEMGEIHKLLARNDFVLANLETPVSDRGTPDPRQDRHVAFCARPSSLEIVRKLGASAVTLANNHMLDYGPIALTDTLKHLDNFGIRYFGAGPNYQSANEPLLTEVNGVKVAFIGSVFIFSSSTCRAKRDRPGVADYKVHVLLRQIHECRSRGYIVIVTIHWGLEYSCFPLQYQRRQARQMIDAGATLILGHGPHYPQGIEKYKHGEIVFSLGNFIFDEPYLFSNRSFIYSARIDRNSSVVSSSVEPIHIENHVPHLTDGPERAKLARSISSLHSIYRRKNSMFWQDHNNLYFRDIVRRVVSTKSAKFLFLPPLSFYMQVGLRNYVRKIATLFAPKWR